MHWAIRSATDRDFPAILDLWLVASDTRTVSDSSEGLRALVARDSQALLVAEADGVLIGSLIAAWDGWRASFYRLAVHPDHRRLGVASDLLRAGERRLIELGARRLTAIVVADDPLATGFWQASGYDVQPNRSRFIKQP